jgi:hypothetical protein
MAEFKSRNLEPLLELFNQANKADVHRHCRSLKIYGSDFAGLVLTARVAVLNPLNISATLTTEYQRTYIPSQPSMWRWGGQRLALCKAKRENSFGRSRKRLRSADSSPLTSFTHLINAVGICFTLINATRPKREITGGTDHTYTTRMICPIGSRSLKFGVGSLLERRHSSKERTYGSRGGVPSNKSVNADAQGRPRLWRSYSLAAGYVRR